MNTYSVNWKDLEGHPHSQNFEAQSASGAISLAIEKISLLKDNPNLITRVFQEQPDGQ